MSNITYYVSVDSQYRDNSQYPLETDFGVRFKPEDYYATYPDGSFFYPETAQQYANTGAYNPPGLAPNPSSITGSGIVYPTGEPINSNQVFPRITIDKNYIDSFIQVKGGKVFQVKEVGDYVYMCGVVEPSASPNNNMGIVVQDITFFSYNYIYDPNPMFQPVWLVCLKKNTAPTFSNQNLQYLPVNMLIMQPDVPGSTANTTKYVDMIVNNQLGFVFIEFDFKALQFQFARKFYEFNPAFDIISNYGALVTLPITFTKPLPKGALATSAPSGSQEWSDVMIVGFDITLSSYYTYNNTPWGYHTFSSQMDLSPPISMTPPQNGTNQLTSDAAGNLFTAVHTNPTSMETYELTFENNLFPIVNNFNRQPGTQATKNSKPLANTLVKENTVPVGDCKTFVLCCDTNASQYIYDVYIQCIDQPYYYAIDYPVQFVKENVNVGGVGSLISSNDAEFFLYNNEHYVALNAYEANQPALRIYKITFSPLAVTYITGAYTMGVDSQGVVALSVCQTRITSFYPQVAIAITNRNMDNSNEVCLYSFNGSILSNRGNYNISSSWDITTMAVIDCSYYIKGQPPASVLQYIYLAVVTSYGLFFAFAYDPATNTITSQGSEGIPDGNPRSVSMYTAPVVGTGQRNLYIALVSTQDTFVYTTGMLAGSSPASIPMYTKLPSFAGVYFTSSSYNLSFEYSSNFLYGTYQDIPSLDNVFYLCSNINTNVGQFFNVSVPDFTTYKVGNSFTKNFGNLWFARDRHKGRIYGFTSDFSNQANNRIYVSIGAPLAKDDVQYITSDHIYTGLGAADISPFTDFVNATPLYITTIEDPDPDTGYQRIFVFNNKAGANQFTSYNVSSFPTIEENTFGWGVNFLPVVAPYANVNMYWAIGNPFTNNIPPINNLRFPVIVAFNRSLLTSTWINPYNVTGVTVSPSYHACGYRNPQSSNSYCVNVGLTGTNYSVNVYKQWSTTPIYTIDSMIDSTTTLVLCGTTFTFADNITYYVMLTKVNPDTFSTLYFFDITNGVKDPVFFQLPVQSNYYRADISTVQDPVTLTTNIFVEIVVDASMLSNSSTIVTLNVPAASYELANAEWNISSLLQQFTNFGQTLSSGVNLQTRKKFLLTLENDVSPNYSRYAQVYDVTTNEYFQFVGLYIDQNFFYAKEYMTVLLACFSNRTIAITYNGIFILNFIDVLSQEQATIEAIKALNAQPNIIPIYGVGGALVQKINNDGSVAWSTALTDIAETYQPDLGYVYQPALYTAQNINVTGLEIDPANLNLYTSVDWQTKIGVQVANAATGSNRLINTTDPEYSNSCIIKYTTSEGQPEYVIPMFNTNNINTLDLSVTSSNVVVGLNLEGLTTQVFEKQLPQTNTLLLSNPTVLQSVVNIPFANNVALVSFAPDGTYQWSNKIISDINNTYVAGVSMAKSNDNIYIFGDTNSNKVNFYSNTDTVQQFWYNQLPLVQSTGAFFSPFYTFISKYDNAGNYLESDFVQSNLSAKVTAGYININSDLNVVDVIVNATLFTDNNIIITRNKDGSAGSFDTYDYTYSLFNGTTYDAFSYFNFVARYKINTNFTDVNGKEYSQITVYKDVISESSVDMFTPYSTGSLDLINKYIYVPALNQNLLIRSDEYDAATETYTLTLNQKIDTSVLQRYLPAYVIYPQLQAATSVGRYDAQFFYIANISSGVTSTYGLTLAPGPSAVLMYTNNVIDQSQQYYLVSSNSTGAEFVVPVKQLIPVGQTPGAYIVRCDTTKFLAGRSTNWVWVTAFNPSALYTLQFYPAALGMVEYYTVALQNLSIPNRDIRDSTIPGVRNLSDFRYVWLEIYNADDDDVADTEFVNNTFSNNPNRNNKVLFEIPVTSAGGGSNFSFYGSGQTPRIKFNPGFYNLRIRLLDPNGQVVVFDATPSPNNSGDAVFTSVVDDTLMNITVELALTKYSST